MQGVLALFEGYRPARALLALSYLKNRQFAEAVRLADALVAEDQGGDRFSTVPTFVYAMAGNLEQAREQQVVWEARARSQWLPPTAMALLYTGLGQNEAALDWLEKACRERDPWVGFLPRDPAFESLRDGPVFQRLLSTAR